MSDCPCTQPARAASIWRRVGVGCLLLWCGPGLVHAGETPTVHGTSLLLVSLDTTRADHLGCYGDLDARTPVLDSLAARGRRYANAVSPSPLTLPAHASLLTGLDTRAHGLRDNGIGALPEEVPTLAAVLAAHGYATAAFVSSRVLDRRFGLDRGFAHYDDFLPAERLGEFGYPERDARAVTDAALDWLRPRAGGGEPWFLWVHYYDAHSPYTAPAPYGARGYAGEISYVDSQLGRLLAALPDGGRTTLVAVVGDHGEALGEHGETGHGIFLYGATLQVPLILAGPAIPAGEIANGLVGTVDLAPHLQGLLLTGGNGGPALPRRQLGDTKAIVSETLMPAHAYGWAPLEAVTLGHERFIRAPRPELYDLATDPRELRDLAAARPQAAERLRRELRRHNREGPSREAAALAPDPELAASLRSLGYLGTASAGSGDGIDPKDGIALLADFTRAKEMLVAGNAAGALPILEELVRRNPANVPFLSRLGTTQLALGRSSEGLATLRRAVQRNPTLDFPHLQLAEAYFQLGRRQEAINEFRTVVRINPRFTDAWMRLGELSGDLASSAAVLEEAVAAGNHSAALYTVLGELQARLGRKAEAEASAQRALGVLPDWWQAWVLAGRLAAERGDVAAATARYRRALEIVPGDPQILAALAALPAPG